jgi:hypothetical protein
MRRPVRGRSFRWTRKPRDHIFTKKGGDGGLRDGSGVRLDFFYFSVF